MEIWKDVIGYERMYQISSIGNLRSLDREYMINGGVAFKKGQPIKQKTNPSGYIQYMLSKDGKKKYIWAHRLVAKAFIDLNNHKRNVNHINGNKQDNSVENLEWCSHKENTKHAIENGLMDTSGVKNGMSKFSFDEIFQIRCVLKSYKDTGFTLKYIAKVFEMDLRTLMSIKSGDTYKRIRI